MCCFDIYKMPELAALHNQPHTVLAKTALQNLLWRRRGGEENKTVTSRGFTNLTSKMLN